MALSLRTSQYSLNISGDNPRSAMETLEKAGFDFILRSANRAYYKSFGLGDLDGLYAAPLRSRSRYYTGDIIPNEDWTELVYVGFRPPQRRPSLGASFRSDDGIRRIEVGSISTTGIHELVCKIQGCLVEGIAEPSLAGSWEPTVWVNEKFDELRQRGIQRVADFSSHETSAALLLEGIKLRNLARELRIAGAMLSDALAKRDPSRVGIEHLLNSGLAGQETVIICRKTSNALIRPSLKKQGAQAVETDWSCAECGRPLSEERHETLFTATDLGRKLLDHSNWMSVLLVEELNKVGVSTGNILLEFQEESEEVDAFVNIDGTILMFELKDKELAIGHAYAISGRLGIYQPDYLLVVSSDRVSAKVREYFEKLKPKARTMYAEGLEDFRTSLTRFAERIRWSRVCGILKRFESLTLGADLPRLVGARLGMPSEYFEEEDTSSLHRISIGQLPSLLDE